ncbi:MAG: hypothetical protein ACK5HR_04550 [Mycoplasmatales bacterium]
MKVNRYMVKIPSLNNKLLDKNTEVFNLKIFKKRDIENNKLNEFIKHLDKSQKRKTYIENRQDISFILNRYNAHKLMKQLFGNSQNYSYTVKNNKIDVEKRD